MKNDWRIGDVNYLIVFTFHEVVEISGVPSTCHSLLVYTVTQSMSTANVSY